MVPPQVDARFRGRGGRGAMYAGRAPGRGRGFVPQGVTKPPMKKVVPSKPNPKLPGPEDFPPLPSTSVTSVTSGYDKQAFQRYSKQEIIEILTPLQLEAVPLPQDLPGNHPAVSPEMVKEIELTRPLKSSDGPESSPQSYSEVAREKKFVEACIRSEDIKQPEVKPRRNSQKKSSDEAQNRERSGSNKQSRGGKAKGPQRGSRNSRPDDKGQEAAPAAAAVA